MRNFPQYAVLFFVFLFLPGCLTVYNPATGREEFYLISPREEIKLGEEISRQIRETYQVENDPAYFLRLRGVAEKIVPVSDRDDISYHFAVLNAPEEINAFAAPGGYVYVTRELMDLADDDELANVIGHEVGHIAARHGVKKIQARMGVALIYSLIFPEEKEEKLGDARQITDVMINLVEAGYSREDEFLADRLGVKYAHKAGYDPRGMITFLEKLSRESEGKPSGLNVFFSSHPPYHERAAAVERQIVLLRGEGG